MFGWWVGWLFAGDIVVIGLTLSASRRKSRNDGVCFNIVNGKIKLERIVSAKQEGNNDRKKEHRNHSNKSFYNWIKLNRVCGRIKWMQRGKFTCDSNEKLISLHYS